MAFCTPSALGADVGTSTSELVLSENSGASSELRGTIVVVQHAAQSLPAAAADQRSIIRGPVGDAVFRFVRGMDS